MNKTQMLQAIWTQSISQVPNLENDLIYEFEHICW